MRKLFKPKVLLLLIVLLATFLLFWQLGTNPPGLSWDEAAWGYNAYSLGLTGKDEFGRLWPLDYLESFGDFKPPVYAYLTILPVKIFGLNEFATRFPSAFFGTLTVVLTYFLVKEIFRKSPFAISYSLLASFLLAISPWHIMLSRAALEANVASFFIIGGVTAFLRGIRDKDWWLILAAASFALSLQTFNTARVVSPLLALLLLVGFRKKLWLLKKWLLLAFLTGFMILAPAISFYLTPQAKLRFKEVNIFSDASVVETANQEMKNDHWTWWSRLIHNRRWGYLRLFLCHYFDHFNPAFLFIKGDGNPKFSTQDVGELYLWELPFLVAGILWLLKRKEGFWWIIPLWLLIGIIPAATARETPHALRIETTLPTWQILIAFGVLSFINFLNKIKVRKIFKFSLVSLIFSFFILNFVYFQHGYWRHFPVEYAGEWQYGYKQSIDFIKRVESNYDEIFFADKLGRPYIFFLFYFKKHPQEFRNEAIVERDVFGFVNVKSIGKYRFFRLGENLLPQGKKTLYIDSWDKIPSSARVIKTFYLPSNEPNIIAFEL